MMAKKHEVLAWGAGGVTLLAVLGPLAPMGSAQKLEKEQCDAVKAEQTKLGGRKLRDALEKGPDWAKANLSAAEFAAMAAFIDLEERLLFRCPQPKPQKAAVAKEQPALDVVEDDDKPGAKAAKAGEKAEKKPAPPKKAAAETAKPAAESKPKPAQPAPKPKTDAYVPPKKTPGED
jgi:outer membrane biosynthesis protein TonB